MGIGDNDMAVRVWSKSNAIGTSLLALPAELLQHILGWLEPTDLVKVAQTCRRLSLESYDDQIWHRVVNRHIPQPISNPGPARSFRELFAAHHPHWFVPRSRIWFGDTLPGGKLLLARYNEGQGIIEALTVVARRGAHTVSFWEKNSEVVIHNFEPVVSLDLNQAVLRLRIDSRAVEDLATDQADHAESSPKSRYSQEILMDTFAEFGLHSSFMLCRVLPKSAVSRQTSVWPPHSFPATSRTRSDSTSGFSSTGHSPTTYDEISQDSFRLRKWVQYTGRRQRRGPGVISLDPVGGISAALRLGMPYFASASGLAGGLSIRMPEDVTTYSTLPEWCYTPTPQKPWQGIWVGDYSGHGCEFLLITQPDKEDERSLPAGLDELYEWFQGRRRDSNSTDGSFASAVEEQERAASEPGSLSETTQGATRETSPLRQQDDYHDGPTGRLEAIKLTGDPNIPRGEYTFVAPDIGPAGFIRMADEEPFQGARVVRSAGHIAERHFRDDRYTPSQLIMISHDRLAQFWEGYGHISYFQRVDLDALSRYE